MNQIGNSQAALLYPGTWLFALPSFPLALASYIILHQGLSCWGVYKVSRSISVSVRGAVFSSLTWGFSGALAARLPFLCQWAAWAWMPWVVFFSLRLGRRGTSRDVAGLACALALCFFAGQPRALFFALCAACISYLSVVDFRARPRSALAFLSALAWSGFLALGQALPFLELGLQSVRSGAVAMSSLDQGGWEWRHWLHLFLPTQYGDMTQTVAGGPRQMWSGFGYVGLWGILLAIRGFFTLPKTAQWKWFLLALILAEAGSGGIMWSLGRAVFPPLTRIRFPENGVLLLCFGAALLAGRGWDAYEKWGQSHRASIFTNRGVFRFHKLGALMLVSGILILVFHDSVFHESSERKFDSSPQSRTLSGLTRGLGLLLLGSAGSPALVLAQILDLADIRRKFSPSVSNSFYDSTENTNLQSAGRQLSQNLDKARGARVYRVPGSPLWKGIYDLDPLGFLTYLRMAYIPNLPAAQSIRLVQGKDPMPSERFELFWKHIHPLGRFEPESNLPWMNSSFVLFASPVGLFSTGLSPQTGDAVKHLALPAWPMARMVEAIPVAHRSAALRSLRRWGPEPLPVEIQSPNHSGGQSASPDKSVPSSGRVTLYQEDERGSLNILLSPEAAGWLFISRSYDPATRAWSNGEPRRIKPAGVMFTSVFVHEGDSEIEVRFEPASFWIGYFASCLALACLLGWLAAKKVLEIGID